MAFDYYHEFYGAYVGVGIRGTVGKKYIYQIVHGIQKKYAYYQAPDPNSPAQLRLQDIFKKAVLSWKALPESEKNFYRRNEPYKPIMSGYNYYLSNYIKKYI